MISRFNMVLQGIRDVSLIVISIYTVGTLYSNWANDQPHYFLLSIFAGFLILSIINTILLLAKVERKAYFYFNTIVQLFPFIFFTMFIVSVWSIFLIILNIAVLVTLRGKKVKEPAT